DVHGYDRVESRITNELQKEGTHIHFEEDTTAIPQGVDLVIYTPAIPSTHKELVHFRNTNIPVIKRAEALGIISRSQKTIAIAGTHGKTTTSTLVTHILRTGGVDCTAFLGGISNDLNSNFVFGKSDWVVVEADEFDRSFLHLNPYYSVVTSTDADHLDIYGTHDVMLESFKEFSEKNNKKGEVFLHEDVDDKIERKGNISSHNYGIGTGKNKASNIRVINGFFHFDFQGEDISIKDIKTTLPGRHNITNATAAIILALKIGVSANAIKEALASFKGIWRRFEFQIRREDFVYIDDYAHHPSELNAAIGAAKELFPNKEITGIFQPHLYTRTRDFAQGFAESLDTLNNVLLMDIYPAREEPIENVTSDMLVNLMQNKRIKRVSKENLLHQLELSKPQVLLTLGGSAITNENGDFTLRLPQN
ncbi:MAG: UDP-N-acetylmuramate--L-alanine ligase, partial [Saprospiraceae bacterium]